MGRRVPRSSASCYTRSVTDAPGTRYAAIAAHLRELVASGEPGDRLPSDAELCERFGVSRMTARQAMQILAADGLLERRRGSGTYIATPRVLRTLGSPLSFTESMRRRGMVASSELLAGEFVDPSEDERAALDLDAGDRGFMLERLRLADGTPMAIERAVMPMEIADAIGHDVGTGSLHAAFERAGRIPTRANAQVTARRASKREARLLDLPTSGVVLSERRTIFDQDRRPLERTETCYAADRYSFEAVLYREDDR